MNADKRFRFLRTEGIVLRSTPFAETDRLVTFYTRQYGKLRAVAKGARRPTCRFASVVEPGTHARLFFYRKPNKELALMTQHEIIQSFRHLRTDLDRYLQTCYLLELMDRFTSWEDPNRVIWHLLCYTLNRLQEDPSRATLWLATFEVRLLSVMGYHVRLGRCVSCEEEFGGKAGVFDSSSVGIRCSECHDGEEESEWWLPVEAIKLAQNLQGASFEELETLTPQGGHVASIRSMLLPLLHRFSETPHEFRTLAVARSLL